MSSNSVTTLNEISIDAVSSHSTPNDAWLIIDDLICDVTDFLSQHPGGDLVLLPFLGHDGTDAFKKMRHSVEAEHLVRTLAVGKLRRHQKKEGEGEDDGHRNGPLPVEHQGAITTPIVTKRKDTTPLSTQSNVSTEILSSTTVPKQTSILDPSQPLIQQVFRLSHRDYCKLLDEKHFDANPPRLFSNRVFECLSRTQWFVIPLLWLPVACYSMYLAVLSLASSSYCRLSFLFFPFLWIVGIFFWTFFEYQFHRFLFHYAEKRLPNHGAAFVIHFTAHAIHHVFPMDRLRLVMPPVLFLMLSTPVFVVSKYLLCLHPALLYSLWSGGLCGYVMYDMIHYTSHFCSFYTVPYLRDMKKYHMKHHYQDSSLGYGVSSKLWDIVFGTQLP